MSSESSLYDQLLSKSLGVLKTFSGRLPGVGLLFRDKNAKVLASDKTIREYDDWYNQICMQKTQEAFREQRAIVSLARRIGVPRYDYQNLTRPEWIQEIRLPIGSIKGIEGPIALELSFDVTDSVTNANNPHFSLTDLPTFDQLTNFPIEFVPDYMMELGKDGEIKDACRQTEQCFGISKATANQRYFLQDLLSELDAQSFPSLTNSQGVVYRAMVAYTWDGFAIPVITRLAFVKHSGTYSFKATKLTPVLVETLKRYSRVLEGGKVCGWEFNSQTGQFYGSTQWSQELGLSKSSIVSLKDFLDLVSETDRFHVEAAFTTAKGNTFIDIPFSTTSNPPKHFRLGGFRSEDELFLSGRLDNISSMIDTKQQAEVKQALLDEITENSPDFIFVKDENGKFVFMNKTLRDYYGIPHSEAQNTLYQGRSDRWFFRGDDRLDIEAQLQGFERSDRDAIRRFAEATKIEPCKASADFSIESIVAPHDSIENARWYKTAKIGFNFAGRPHVLGIATDITQLALQLRILEEIFTKSPTAMYFKDIDGRYCKVNQAFATTFGLEEYSILGKTAADFFDIQTCNKLDDQDKKAFAGITSDSEADFEELVFKNGERRLYRGVKIRAPILERDGKTRSTKIAGIYIDVTTEPLAQRYALLEPLLRSIHHDFVPRTLVNLACALESKKQWSELEVHKKYWKSGIQMALGYLDRLKWLCDGQVKMNESPTSLRSCIETAIALANDIIENPQVDVVAANEEDLDLLILTDFEGILTILCNLLENSKKYTTALMNQSGSTGDWLSRKIKLNVSSETLEDLRTIRVIVDDAGPGLPSHVYEEGLESKIFEPNIRIPNLKNPSSALVAGTGFGLYFVREMVQRCLLGKVIQPVASSRGGLVMGFEFCVQLPEGRLVQHVVKKECVSDRGHRSES